MPGQRRESKAEGEIRLEAIKAEDTYPLRRELLRKGMTLSHVMSGDFDPKTLHLGLFLDQRLISIASYMPASHEAFRGNQYQLRGMATATEHQSKGYGRLLIQEAEHRLRKCGVDLIWCNARIVALDFYRKMGYSDWGEIFELPQIGPHLVMFKKL